MFTHKLLFSLLIIALLAFVYVPLPDTLETERENFNDFILYALYWIGLGIASSIGLGTGLHTFILYLGPHIAQVVMGANECN